jgi:hypothetical protein
MAHVIENGRRECLQIGSGAPYPDDGLHLTSIGLYTDVCKISHIRARGRRDPVVAVLNGGGRSREKDELPGARAVIYRTGPPRLERLSLLNIFYFA